MLVVYDITNDRARAKIADACLDYGLDRIQYSAFAGELSRNHQVVLKLMIDDLLGQKSGKVQLLPICQKDWEARIVIERENGDE